MSENPGKSSSGPVTAPSPNADSERSTSSGETFEVPDLEVLAAPGVPVALAGSGSLDRLVDTAKDYARQSTAENTNAAYKADWAHFSSWCRRRGADPLGGSGAEPQMIGPVYFGMRLPYPAYKTVDCGHHRAASFRPRLALPAARVHPLIARTVTSPPFWPGSNASTRGRRYKKKPSSLRTISI